MGTTERKERELRMNAEAAEASAQAPPFGQAAAFLTTDWAAMVLSEPARLGVKL